MQTLLDAIAATSKASLAIATPEHLAWIMSELHRSLAPIRLEPTQTFECISACPGLYYFDIAFPFRTDSEFDHFLERWGRKGGGSLQTATARAYTKRASQHKEKVRLGQPVPFYIGKHKNIRSRVTQHLTGSSESGTYGLKLLSRSELLKGCTIRVGGVALVATREGYFCVEFLESALRSRLHPVVGRQ